MINKISEIKNELRKEIKQKRSNLSQEDTQLSDKKIIENIISLPQFKKAKTVFLYVGKAGEINTAPLIEYALGANKQVCVPLCTEKGIMLAKKITSLNELQQGSYGIMQPRQGSRTIEKAAIDFALVPCLSCDEKGYRLGYGGGYYDRYLANSNIFAACACRSELMQEEIPIDSNDVQCGCIINENKIFHINLV